MLIVVSLFVLVIGGQLLSPLGRSPRGGGYAFLVSLGMQLLGWTTFAALSMVIEHGDGTEDARTGGRAVLFIVCVILVPLLTALVGKRLFDRFARKRSAEVTDDECPACGEPIGPATVCDVCGTSTSSVPGDAGH